jgi:hypothetical protein
VVGYKKWKVGPTQAVSYGTGPAGEGSGYGFSIRERHGSPLLSVLYAAKEDAEIAEAVVRAALAKAVRIESPTNRHRDSPKKNPQAHRVGT